MKKPITVLAILPLLMVAAPSGAQAEHRDSRHVKKKLIRLADDVADSARAVHRTAAGRHGRFGSWGPPRGRYNRSFYGPRNDYTLRLLSDLEHRARDFERVLHHRPLVHTHREFELLARSFDRAAEALYRARLSPALERDFECLAEYMFTLAATYEEYAYPRRARYRPGYRSHDGRYGGRVEVYGPRWNVSWQPRGWLRDDWDSDSDSDSY